MKLLPSWNPKRLSIQLLFACTAWMTVSSSHANTLSFSSGTEQTQLIELYTSEGCSSCPPADRWLTQLKSDPRLWQDFVPVAFHVDYWDYIGWTDRFAKPSHAARQRQHAKLGNVKTVYTPGFVVNGTEWRGWFQGQALPASAAKTGVLSAKLTNGAITIIYHPTDSHPRMTATIAAMGAGDTSQVKSGENANKTLAHDFAVLSQRSISMKYQDSENAFEATANISLPDDAKAIAVWVSSEGDLRPLQATGTWLARN
jgi:hypothetical protein